MARLGAVLALFLFTKCVWCADIQSIVGQMTPEEKFSLLNGATGTYVGQTPNVSRVGIPSLNLQDAGQGFRTSDERIVGEVTSWSCSLGLAATWDPSLVRQWADATAQEFKEKGANVILGPGLNVHRVPKGGRNAEYMSGEDPFLGSTLAKEYVEGFQSNGIIAVMKHFALNNQETLRDDVDSIIPNARTLFEVYYPPFQACVDSGVGSVMCSYNLVNGTHACENEQLLMSDLKSTMGFDGWVMSDWGATHSTTPENGLDQDMDGSDGFYSPENLADVDASIIDDMVTRILTAMDRVGLLNSSVCNVNYDCDPYLFDVNVTSRDHEELAEKIATQSVLLLKNEESTLPLEPTTVKKIAVVGEACAATNDVDQMLAQWNIGNYYVIGGSGRVIPDSVITIADGIKSRADGIFDVTYVLTDDMADAADAIADADVVVACAGTNSTESVDRSTLLLDQDAFLTDLTDAANQAQIPVVVCVMSPGVWIGEWSDDADAVINIYLGGKATGSAIASVLFGDSNPSAKSPVTYPVSEDDTVQPCQTVDCEYTEGLFVGYRQFDAQNMSVVFPFGHGLSFTTFEYSPLTVNLTSNLLELTVEVSNTGGRTGADVPQLYVQFPEAAEMPPKVLKGFKRTGELAPGASEIITFTLQPDEDLRIWNIMNWDWEPVHGDFLFYVGASSRDIRSQAPLTV